MSRRLSLLLVAAIFGGGWYFVDGPGKGRFGEYVPPPLGGLTAPAGHGTQQPATISRHAAPAPPPAAQLAPPPDGETIRIASFNIQVFGNTKASKPHVMATLGAIVRNFHLVAIQEIRTQDDYLIPNFLRDYVNQAGRQYDYVLGPRLGRTRSTEQYAYVFDTAAIEVNRRSVYTVNDPDDLLHRPPLVAMFRARGPPPEEAFTFILVNIHTDPDETDTELDALALVYRAVRRAAGGEDDIILLGDLNVDDQNLGALGEIPGIWPVVRDVPTNTRQTRLYDNIILHRPSTSEFTGRWGVYNFEAVHHLTREQALEVSDHFPVWAEFSTRESTSPGRFATGRATIRAQ